MTRGHRRQGRQQPESAAYEAVELRLGGLHARAVHRGVYFGEQLALLDPVADLHVQRAQLSGHLGADVDIVAWLQRAGGADRIFEIAFLHHGRGEALASTGALAPGEPDIGSGSNRDKRRQPDEKFLHERQSGG